MKGYLSPDAPGELQPLGNDGWYDTGDVVAIDDEGYVSIRGRLKRFAKIGGEMVSLTVVENCACSVWPGNMHAAAILPDPKKGEQIVLLTDYQEPDRAHLLRWAQSHGVPEIAVPKKILSVDAIPVLGTGKTDFVSVTALAKEQLEQGSRPKKIENAPEASNQTAVQDADMAQAQKDVTPDSVLDGIELPKAAE